MTTFKVFIHHSRINSIRFTINYKRLNIQIQNISINPDPIPAGDPDTELTLCLLSGDLAEVFYLADFARQQMISIDLH